MDHITDERLEKLLADYYGSEPEVMLTYRADTVRKAIPAAAHLRKRIVAAASLVLVTLISVSIYFSFSRNPTSPESLASSPLSSTPSEPVRGGGTNEADGDPRDQSVLPTQSVEKSTEAADGDSLSAVKPTKDKPPAKKNPADQPNTTRSDEAPAKQGRQTEPSSNSDWNDPAAAPAAQKPTSPAAGERKTEEPTQASKTTKPSPDEKPAEPTQTNTRPQQEQPKATQHPTTPVKPEPTTVPSSPMPTQKPTIPRDPPWNPEPVEPTDSGDDPTGPVVYPTQPEPKNYCYGYFKYDGGALYCWIADENGSVMGDPDLLGAQHRAEIVYTYPNGYVLARWSPNEHGIRPSGGYHKYTFLNASGEKMFEDYVHAQGVY